MVPCRIRSCSSLDLPLGCLRGSEMMRSALLGKTPPAATPEELSGITARVGVITQQKWKQCRKELKTDGYNRKASVQDGAGLSV
ncbi:hypothetical protein AV530_011285 [Patagioenas fasciata monilis]|uniref:Uncharacterized protein n=1 Tax=Patagioenas fasciata monilis TaxID=372326 RepID=A0A1V4KNV1_PATFA|nr:hypothetical protein AV530_011285 [Patagioenas fasciata monilis]